MKITKFKYHWDMEKGTEKLWIFTDDWHEITKRKHEKYGGWYWEVNPTNKSHWIQTIIRMNRIDTFYKIPAQGEEEKDTFYKKQLPRIEVNEWTFEEIDIQERDPTTGKFQYKHKGKQSFTKGQD